MKDHLHAPVLMLTPDMRIDRPESAPTGIEAQSTCRPKPDLDRRFAEEQPSSKTSPTRTHAKLGATIDARANQPVLQRPPPTPPPGGGSGGGRGANFHKRVGPEDFNARLQQGRNAVWRNLPSCWS
jgi:hypothetical protein